MIKLAKKINNMKENIIQEFDIFRYPRITLDELYNTEPNESIVDSMINPKISDCILYVAEINTRINLHKMNVMDREVYSIDDVNVYFNKELITFKRCKIGMYLYDPTNNTKLVVLDERLRYAPRCLIDYVIYHEIGHSKDISFSKISWFKRWTYILSGKLDPNEMFATEYVVKRNGKDYTLEALQYLLKRTKGLIERRELKNFIKTVEKM